MPQVFHILDEATKASVTVLGALTNQNDFSVATVRSSMDLRSDALQRLEEFVASEVWAIEKRTVNANVLREKFDELMALDEKIRKHLRHRANEHETSRDDVKRELNAQNSYNRATQRQSTSFFLDNKLHG